MQSGTLCNNLSARNGNAPPEHPFFPFPADFLDTIHEYLQPLEGYTPDHNVGDGEVIRRSALGG